MSEPGALSGALAWYRAASARALQKIGPVLPPTLYVWSSGDTALGRNAAERTREWVIGPYRFEVLEGVSHWIQREEPDRLVQLLLSHLSDRTEQ
jgi:pimeloyl-ACP methyl ester carboxylesterase